MTFRFATRLSGTRKLLSLAAVAVGVLLLSQSLLAPRAHAQDPGDPGAQGIVLPGKLNISTDKMTYHVGERIQVCYHLPEMGYIQIYDRQPGKQTKLLKSERARGGMNCFMGIVTPPYGKESLILRYTSPKGKVSQTHTSFAVVQAKR